MAKRKKKKTVISPKVLKAQQKKHFFKTLIRIVKAAGSLEYYYLIPKKELEIMYIIRFVCPYLTPEKEGSISKTEMTIIRKFVSIYLKQLPIPINKDGSTITLFEFFSVGLTLKHFLRTLEDNKFSQAKTVKLGFKPFLDFVSNNGNPQFVLNEIIKLISYSLSQIDGKTYNFTPYFSHSKNGVFRLRDGFQITVQAPEVKHFYIDQVNRPAYHIAVPFREEGIVWFQIPAHYFQKSTVLKGLKLDVYIQSHALIRLKERLDCVDEPILHTNVLTAFLNLDRLIETNGRYLLEYQINSEKVGYLILEPIEGIVLIRTFLFLTNNGTPEGKYLLSHNGLQKEDKKYWSIDKLSTFLTSGIRENDKLKEIFINAGCDSLFRLNPDSFEIEKNMKSQAEGLEKYLT